MSWHMLTWHMLAYDDLAYIALAYVALLACHENSRIGRSDLGNKPEKCFMWARDSMILISLARALI